MREHGFHTSSVYPKHLCIQTLISLEKCRIFLNCLIRCPQSACRLQKLHCEQSKNIQNTESQMQINLKFMLNTESLLEWLIFLSSHALNYRADCVGLLRVMFRFEQIKMLEYQKIHILPKIYAKYENSSRIVNYSVELCIISLR